MYNATTLIASYILRGLSQTLYVQCHNINSFLHVIINDYILPFLCVHQINILSGLTDSVSDLKQYFHGHHEIYN